jgi:hypothetical protein
MHYMKFIHYVRCVIGLKILGIEIARPPIGPSPGLPRQERQARGISR